MVDCQLVGGAVGGRRRAGPLNHVPIQAVPFDQGCLKGLKDVLSPLAAVLRCLLEPVQWVALRQLLGQLGSRRSGHMFKAQWAGQAWHQYKKKNRRSEGWVPRARMQGFF